MKFYNVQILIFQYNLVPEIVIGVKKLFHVSLRMTTSGVTHFVIARSLRLSASFHKYNDI